MTAQLPGDVGEGTDALLSAARSLWPGSTIELGGGGDGEVLAAVPDLARARLLVPLRSSVAAGAAVRRISAASTHREVVTRLTVDATIRATHGRVLHDRVVVHPAPGVDTLGDHLARVLGGPVTFALGVGPARVNRKPVLQVFDERGRPVAFVKVGDSVQARADVGAEAVALRRLRERSFAALAVPRLHDVSEWNGMLVLVMSALRPRPTVRRRPAVPHDAMSELACAFRAPPTRLGELAWWQRRRALVDTVTDDRLRASLSAGWDAVTDRHGSAVVGVGAWHGDWTPWNMAYARSTALVWDWERFEEGAPLGLDSPHFVVQRAVRAAGLDPAVVLHALGGRRAPSAYADLLDDVYLLAISARYAALLHAERGADVAHAARTMAAALETRMGTRTVLG